MGKVANFRIWDAVLVVAAFGVLLFGLGMYVYFGFGPLGMIAVDSIDSHIDFYTFWESAQALWNGEDIYNTGIRVTNLNPPFWTVLFSPLGLLGPMVAYKVFVLLAVLTSVGYLAWMASELRLRAGWATIGVVMLLLSTPLYTTISIGQIYPFLALGLVAAWVADRHEKPMIAGLVFGLVVAVKPPLAPVVLWPLLRRRWRMLGATFVTGVLATLAGAMVAGLGTTLEWVKLLPDVGLDGTWYNASLPGAASRLFMENEYTVPLATLPEAIRAAYAVGIALLFLTAWKVQWDRELELWALVAASILISPVGWYDYLVLLGPGVLVLLARGRVALALLLLALQTIPGQWVLLWQDEKTVVATLALTLYLYILLAHWLAFLLIARKEPTRAPEVTPETARPAVEVGG